MSNRPQPPSSPQRRLVQHRQIRGTITCISGLHIGAGKDSMEIGGNDNPVIRDPMTDLPYIPGSSLKGKMRAMLELRDGHFKSDGSPQGDGRSDCMICRIFGPHFNMTHSLGPTRLIVRDSLLTDEWRQQLRDLQQETGLPGTELKSENLVLRTTGVAKHPRTQERVPAGAVFTFNLSLRVFDDDDAAKMLAFVEAGIRLIEADALGAGGSRGSGQVKFTYATVENS